MEIKLIDLICGYSSVNVLGPINLSFKTNEIYCILGSNGIGKTTLFKTIMGFIPSKNGYITIDDKKTSEISPKEMAHYISYVPQAKNYSYQYTVLEIVVMGRACHIKSFESPSSNDYQIAKDVLEKLRIHHLAEKMYSELSGGEQQIVLIARALAQGAKFIIMDEPASNLDFENQKKVLDVLKNLSDHGMGILMSSHSPDHAFYCSGSSVLITKEKKVIFGTNDNVLLTENLKKVYGIDIEIVSKTMVNGKNVKTCCLL